MVQRIAEALLIRVYGDVSDVVSLDENGEVQGVQMFDTRFGGEWMQAEPNAREIWLMSNHPQGNRMLSDEDMANAARIKERQPFIPLRMFITGEDIGCREVAL